MTTAKTTRKGLDKFGTRIINMTVRAKDGAMVYDSDGNAIPGDQFVSVPVSATLVRAVQYGDLEEMTEDKPAARKSSESDSASKRATAKISE